MKGASIDNAGSLESALVHLTRDILKRGLVASAMIPMAGPDGSCPWTLIMDPDILDRSRPMPRVMSVQGAKALASFTRSAVQGRVLAVMRPCEVRAAIELSKLDQIDLEGVVLLSMDCSGVFPMQKRNVGLEGSPDPSREELRPLCRSCTDFTAAGDLSVVEQEGEYILVPLTDKGRELLEKSGMKADADLSAWSRGVQKLQEERRKTRDAGEEAIRQEIQGLKGLAGMFSDCISCRACRTVCPVCYCRLCFIDMKDRRPSSGDLVDRSIQSGSQRLVPNTLLFHIGRMAHMSLSCVSCGMCQDACPSGIPIGEIVSMVSSSTTGIFGYKAGESPDEPLPLNTFRHDELHRFEDQGDDHGD